MARRSRGIFEGRCALCGANTSGEYCYAHAWAGNHTRSTRNDLDHARAYREGFRDGYRRSNSRERNAA